MRENRKHSKLHNSYRADRGVALIVAVVIIAILIVFTFSLMLIAYSLYSSQNKNVAGMRCAEAASTLSVALCDELTYSNKEEDRYPELESYLYNYLRYNLCQAETWPYYDPEDPEHSQKKAFRYFELKHNTAKKTYNADGSIVTTEVEGETPVAVASDGVDGMPGKTIVCLYWEPPTGVNLANNASGASSKEGIVLHIMVTCESASQSYTAEQELTLKIFTYNAGLDVTDRRRQDAMIAAADNLAVNPCGFDVDTEINKEERWSWQLTNVK